MEGVGVTLCLPLCFVSGSMDNSIFTTDHLEGLEGRMLVNDNGKQSLSVDPLSVDPIPCVHSVGGCVAWRLLPDPPAKTSVAVSLCMIQTDHQCRCPRDHSDDGPCVMRRFAWSVSTDVFSVVAKHAQSSRGRVVTAQPLRSLIGGEEVCGWEKALGMYCVECLGYISTNMNVPLPPPHTRATRLLLPRRAIAVKEGAIV